MADIKLYGAAFTYDAKEEYGIYSGLRYFRADPKDWEKTATTLPKPQFIRAMKQIQDICLENLRTQASPAPGILELCDVFHKTSVENTARLLENIIEKLEESPKK